MSLFISYLPLHPGICSCVLGGGGEVSSWPAIPCFSRPLKWGLGGLVVHFVYKLMLGEKKEEVALYFFLI